MNRKELNSHPGTTPLREIYDEMRRHVCNDFIGYNFINTALDDLPEQKPWYQDICLQDHLVEYCVEIELDNDVSEEPDIDLNDENFEEEFVFLDSPLPIVIEEELEEESIYGHIYGTVQKADESDSYSIEVSSAPYVDQDNPNYYNPVSLYINCASGDISFVIEPQMYQPDWHMATYPTKISMAFYKDEGDQFPRWHTFKNYEGPDGYESEEIDNFLSDAELTSLFLESAVLGTLPGFIEDDDGTPMFSQEHFDALSPAQYGEAYLNLTGVHLYAN